jgi:uncharacterized Zn finger protein
MELNIPIEQTTAVHCENCGNNHFIQALRLQKVSGLLTGQSQPSYIPIPVFSCNKCGHVNKEFTPTERPELDIED